MGVDLEKYVGVVVDLDVSSFTRDYLDDFMDNFTDSFDDVLYNPIKEELLDLNFKRDSNDLKEGDISLVVDGMCGEYKYLMYVLTHDYAENTYDLCKSDDKLNELLGQLEPPAEILEKLGKVHELLVNKPLKNARYLYLNHYT